MAHAPRIAVVIPARLASSRVPQKALAELAGLPLLEHVRRRAMASDVGPVWIATDSARIEERMRGLGANVLRTGPAANGTRRVALAAQHLDVDFVLNVQGDQPAVDPAHIRALASIMDRAELGTIASPWPEGVDPRGTGRVKIAVEGGYATDFSRHVIPGQPPRLHLGLYGYSQALLRWVTSLPIGVRACAEGLEQLTWLEAGLPIRVGCVGPAAPAVDTMEQLEQVRSILQSTP